MEMFFDRAVMGLWPGLRPPKVMKNGFCFPEAPPPCHPDRSAAQWRDLRFSGPFLGMFFDRARRSGEISIWMRFRGNLFRESVVCDLLLTGCAMRIQHRKSGRPLSLC
jgi:hypothetical protein